MNLHQYASHNKSLPNVSIAKQTRKTGFAEANEFKLLIAETENPDTGLMKALFNNKSNSEKMDTFSIMNYEKLQILGNKIHLYSTPSQKRFDFMRELICDGASGMVLVIDHHGPDPLDELSFRLQAHAEFLQHHPVVIAIAVQDDREYDLSAYQKLLADKNLQLEVTRLNVNVQEQIYHVFSILLYKVLSKKPIDKTNRMIPERKGVESGSRAWTWGLAL